MFNVMNLSSLLMAALLVLGGQTLFAAGGSTGGSANGDCQQETKQDPKIDYEKRKLDVDDMSLQLLQFLETNVTQVAIVSRAGSDLSSRKFQNPQHPKYSHAGIVVRNYKGQGVWKFVHLLNTCAGPTSDIYEQSVRDFFTDDPFLYDIVVGVPTPELQKKIVAVLEDTSVGARGWKLNFHNRDYSNIANPFALKYQNSNMWVLSVITAAQSDLKTRPEIQSYYQSHGYKPSQVNIGFWSGVAVSAGFAGGNVKKDDHTQAESSSGWYNFASADSLYDYLRHTDKLVTFQELCHSAGCNRPVAQIEEKK